MRLEVEVGDVDVEAGTEVLEGEWLLAAHERSPCGGKDADSVCCNDADPEK